MNDAAPSRNDPEPVPDTLDELARHLIFISNSLDTSAPAAAIAAAGQLQIAALFDHLPDLIYVKDRQSRFVFANRATAVATRQEGDAIIGKTDFDLWPFDVAQHYFEAEQQLMSGGETMRDVEEICRVGNGEGRWLLTTKAPIRDDSGEIVGLVGVSHDITERKRQDELRRGHAALLEMIARGQPLDTVLEALVRMVEGQLKGITASVLLLDGSGERLEHGVAPNLPQDYVRMIDGVAIGPKVGSCGTAAWRRQPVIVEDALSDPLWEDYLALPRMFGFRSCWSTPIIGPGGSLLGTFALYSPFVRAPTALEAELTAMATDIAGIAIDRKQAEDRIHFMAHHDALTKLPNRILFWQSFDRILEEAGADGRPFAVAYIDLDDFKSINDSLGHAAGDDVLKAIAARLTAALQPGDLATRLGGDEFALIFHLPERSHAAASMRLAEIRNRMNAPVVFEGRAVPVMCSIGLAVFPQDGDTTAALLASADRAMYRIKHGTRLETDHAPENAPDDVCESAGMSAGS